MTSESDVNIKVQSYVIQFLSEHKDEQLQHKIKILIEALTLQLCNYCIIRFLQWENQRLMNESNTVLNNIWIALLQKQNQAIHTRNSQQACQVCQGLCDYIADSRFKEELFETITQSGYEYYEYYLALMIPEYFLILDAITFNKLKDAGCYQNCQDTSTNAVGYQPSHSINRGYKTSNAPKRDGEIVFTQQLDQVIPLKQIIKFILGFFLTPRLGVPVSHTSSFKCLVKLYNNLQLNMEIIEGKKQNSILKQPKNRFQEQQLLKKQRFDEKMARQKQIDGVAPLIKNFINKMYAENTFNLIYTVLDQNEPKISHQFIPERDDVYIGGRYLKYQRGVAQTGEMAKNVQKVSLAENQQPNNDLSEDSEVENRGFLDTSVEALLRDAFREVLQFESFVLVAGGREDMDVRMLTSGRPFLLQFRKLKCINYDWTEQILPKINNILSINNYIQIYSQTGLKFYEKNIEKTMKLLYNAAIEKKKLYKAVIYSENEVEEKELRNKIDQIFDLENTATIDNQKVLIVQQNTPIRVLHRRTLLTRKKYIFQIELDRIINQNIFTINITSSAGTYIKEFVHGDFGRTVPSLSTLLDMKVQIIQLDVREVDVPWPV